jgi:F0F1-type ATP synthase epsilon subunit
MPDDHLTLEILGVGGVLLTADMITSINVRMENGLLIGLRPGHAPLIGSVAKGMINYRIADELFETEVDAGLLSVNKNRVRILTTGA